MQQQALTINLHPDSSAHMKKLLLFSTLLSFNSLFVLPLEAQQAAGQQQKRTQTSNQQDLRGYVGQLKDRSPLPGATVQIL